MIFLDVGGHDGQTLEELVKPGWPFTAVHSFEPMPDQFATLTERFGDRVECHNFGLLDRTGIVDVYGDNANMGSSVYADKVDVNAETVTACQMVRASEWFADHVVEAAVKLNCEGSEVPILLDLCDSGEIHKVAAMMIDFDVRKIPSAKGGENEAIRRLADVGFDRFVLCEDSMHGDTHQDRTRAWLAVLGIER